MKNLIILLLKSSAGKLVVHEVMNMLITFLKARVKNPAIEQSIENIAREAMNDVLKAL